jgi:catechol 2,3-dioxygenase-like lactoylglutathione lyase family enzyme
MTNPTPDTEQRAKAVLHNDTVTVRYQVAQLARSIEFYTERLAFKLEMRVGDAFAAVGLGNLRLILSGPGTSGARPMPDGQKQAPGGWNRILVYVEDLEERIASLKAAGVHFRNTIESGPGGSQILIDDPDGNPIELHQPPG